jgi:hypothetical protein
MVFVYKLHCLVDAKLGKVSPPFAEMVQRVDSMRVRKLLRNETAEHWAKKAMAQCPDVPKFVADAKRKRLQKRLLIASVALLVPSALVALALTPCGKRCWFNLRVLAGRGN